MCSSDLTVGAIGISWARLALAVSSAAHCDIGGFKVVVPIAVAIPAGQSRKMLGIVFAHCVTFLMCVAVTLIYRTFCLNVKHSAYVFVNLVFP